MGRTIPSFRIALAMEQKDWKPFCNALDKKEKKPFDEMFDIPKLYISACSSSVQLMPLQPIAISIIFHHYKELLECIREVEERNMGCSTINNVKGQEAEEIQEIPSTLDSFLIRK